MMPGMSKPRVAEVALPDFGMPGAVPQIPDATYRDRMARLQERATDAGFDRIVVYADTHKCSWRQEFGHPYHHSLAERDLCEDRISSTP